MTIGPAAISVAADAPPSSGSPQAPLFGIRPLHQGQTTLPGGHFNFAAVPGETVSDGLVIENSSDHSLDFHVYGADLLTAAGGGLAPAQATDTMRDGGAWIAVATAHVTIPAHSSFTDNFSVRLPSAVSPGEHRGAIVAAAIVGKTPQGSAIEARTALITLITVPGLETPSGTLGALRKSTAGPAQIGLAITLSNTGNLLLTYAGMVEIFDGGGHRVASLPLTPVDAYVVPSGRIALAALWKDSVPESGTFSARATVTILAKGTPVATLRSQSLDLEISSWSAFLLKVGAVQLVLVLLGLLAAIWPVARKMRGRRRTRARALGNAPG